MHFESNHSYVAPITGYRLIVQVNDENLNWRRFCAGHVGLKLEDPSGKVRYFDYGMIGADITRVKYPMLSTIAACAIIFLSVAFYSALFAAIGHMIGDQSFTATIMGAFIGSLYGVLFSPTIGMWGEGTSQMTAPTNTLLIHLTKEQYYNVITYLERNRIGIYAIGFGNCLTFTCDALIQAGVNLSPVHSSFLTRPSAFAQRLAANELFAR